MGQGNTRGGAEAAGLASITEVTGLISVVRGLVSEIKGAGTTDGKGSETLDTRVEASLTGLWTTLTGVLGLGFISKGRDLGLVRKSWVSETLLGDRPRP